MFIMSLDDAVAYTGIPKTRLKMLIRANKFDIWVKKSDMDHLLKTFHRQPHLDHFKL